MLIRRVRSLRLLTHIRHNKIQLLIIRSSWRIIPFYFPIIFRYQFPKISTNKYINRFQRKSILHLIKIYIHESQNFYIVFLTLDMTKKKLMTLFSMRTTNTFIYFVEIKDRDQVCLALLLKLAIFVLYASIWVSVWA